MPAIELSRSARIDLLGGTLDIFPIYLVLTEVVTLNAALSLKSTVKLREGEGQDQSQSVEIISHDYNSRTKISFKDWTPENIYLRKSFQELNFIVQILDQFPVKASAKGLVVELSSAIPPGSGLGGSSVMGITLCEALVQYYVQGGGMPLSREEILKRVSGIEARVLDTGPTGYQDYYPALYGGILALLPHPDKIQVEQLFNPEFKKNLESSMTLVYSNQSRFSGLNNWEVYKAFFDREPQVRSGLQALASLSMAAYRKIRSKDWAGFLSLVAEEGALRQRLFSGIVTPPMQELEKQLRRDFKDFQGMKVCGAGGGGCFLLVHGAASRDQIGETVKAHGMRTLSLEIQEPI